METHPRGYLHPRGCRPRYPQHIFRSLRTITLLSRLLARGYSTCVAVGKAIFLELPHSSHVHSIFHSRELSAVFTIPVIFTVLGRPCTGHTFSAGVTSHSFIFHTFISSVTVLGTTLDWFCVQQCSRRHIPFIFTSFFSIPVVQFFY